MRENEILVETPAASEQSNVNNGENDSLVKNNSISETIESAFNKFEDKLVDIFQKSTDADAIINAQEVINESLNFEQENVRQQVERMEIDENVVLLNKSNNPVVIVEENKQVQDNNFIEEKQIAEEEQAVEIENYVEKENEEQLQNDKDKLQETNEDLEINNGDETSQESKQLTYDWTVPKLISLAKEEFKPTKTCENFTKGCMWSPDGTCILVPSDDFKIRIFELPRELYSGILPKDFTKPSFESALQVKEGGTIYDTCWFPYMSSWTPSTCCFLSTSQGSPIHLWDAFTGQLRATYRAYNQVDEVEAAVSVQFTDCGGQVWSGFKNALRIFDTDRPGRQIQTIFLKKDFPNITGLVSCIRENPQMSGLVAFGTYSKYIGLYKDGPLCSFQTGNGVTQIEFSPCGTKLYSAVRRGSEFLCWDLRNPGTVLYSLQNRQSDTNQRIHFSLSYSGKDIISGGTDGAVRVWQVSDTIETDEDINPVYKIKISKDCVNGVDLHKNLPILAVSTGCRICDVDEDISRENSLRFYWLSRR